MRQHSLLVPDPNHYVKSFYCSNCGIDFEEIFPKGQVARQGECPNCGVSPGKYFPEDGRPWLKANMKVEDGVDHGKGEQLPLFDGLDAPEIGKSA